MKFIELFAGIGGFRNGLEVIQRGRRKVASSNGSESMLGRGNERGQRNEQPTPYTCVYANEFNKYAAQIYEKNYEKPDTRDIREVKDFPDHELLTAGFPCQSFSIAGKRGGFKDTRGTMFFEIARITKQKQPRLLLLENVKGLLSHDKGKTFATILNTLDELGYDCQWQVLNSKDFGVPQNRERVFIVGHLRGTSRPEVFPIRETFTNSSIKDSTICQCLRANYPGNCNGTYIKNVKIRRLTPTECERLQGFPDGWTEGISDTQRYKCLGNAVTTNVITAIGERL